MYNIELIKNARIKKGLTQTELARRVRKTPSAISAFESGKRGATPNTAKKIADELGLTMDEIVIEEKAS